MKRSLVLSIILIVAVFALASPSARADQITLAGTTSSTVVSGITFTPGSFGATTVGGFAGFTNLGTYSLTSPGTYTGSTVDLTVVFTLPQGINGGTQYIANLFGTVVNNTTGGVSISFTNPSQTITFTNSGGSGVFTFNVNNVALSLNGTATLTGTVTNASFAPIPEPSTIVLLGAGLLLLGTKKLFAIG